MTNEGCQRIALFLFDNYPRDYAIGDTERFKRKIEELDKAYKDYTDDEVYNAYFAYMTRCKFTPYIGEIITLIKDERAKHVTFKTTLEADADNYIYERTGDDVVKVLSPLWDRTDAAKQAFCEKYGLSPALSAADICSVLKERGAIT